MADDGIIIKNNLTTLELDERVNGIGCVELYIDNGETDIYYNSNHMYLYKEDIRKLIKYLLKVYKKL